MGINTRKIKGFINKHKISASIILIALISAAAILIYDNGKVLSFTPDAIIKLKPKDTRVAAPLTGLPVDPSVVTRRPLAVVIENSPEARPQSGYVKADVVYDTLAEGGITRTLAIFQSQASNEIGPVRSARLYFIDWLSEFNAIFSHVGGNIDALDEISAKKIPDLNQFYFGNYYWRSTDRYAPHNVYTTTDKLYAAASKAGLSTSTSTLKWYSFKKDAEEKDRPQSQNVKVNFSGPLYAVDYTYDPKTNDYVRSVGGTLLKDRATGEQVRAKNVIVQMENMSPMVTRAGEQGVSIQTIGSGKAIIFEDGKATTGTWTKTSRNELTKLTEANGNEIKLNPGQTWIEVVPTYGSVNY